MGHKCLEIIVILDSVSRRLENRLLLILKFIFGQAYSDTHAVHKDFFFLICTAESACPYIIRGVNRNVRQKK